MDDRSGSAGFVPYLVFSWEHNGFWRPNRCGYTRSIEEAGRYSKEEAEKICRDALPSAYRPSAGEPPEICFPAPEAFEALRGALEGAKLQLEYLESRWPTGTTPVTIANIERVLAPGRSRD